MTICPRALLRRFKMKCSNYLEIVAGSGVTLTNATGATYTKVLFRSPDANRLGRALDPYAFL